MPCAVSSRTWGGGERRRCPICAASSWVEPALFAHDAPCPRCGQLLWPHDRAVQRSKDLVRSITRPGNRLGRSVRTLATRIRDFAVSVTPTRRGAKPDPVVPTSTGVWDAWLDS